MACATPIGAASPPQFGIPNEESSLKTESVEVTLNADMAELKDGCGNVVNVAFYNKSNDVVITGRGIYTSDIGTSLTLANAALFAGSLLVGALYVTNVKVTLAQGQYVQSAITAKAWDSIAGA